MSTVTTFDFRGGSLDGQRRPVTVSDTGEPEPFIDVDANGKQESYKFCFRSHSAGLVHEYEDPRYEFQD